MQCDTVELKIEYGQVNAPYFGLNVRLSEVDNRSIEIAFDQYNLKVADKIIQSEGMLPFLYEKLCVFAVLYFNYPFLSTYSNSNKISR